jgi:hypothetical protein
MTTNLMLDIFLRHAARVARLKGRDRPTTSDLNCNPLAPRVEAYERAYGSFDNAVDSILKTPTTKAR